jgi:hypothetical protein
MGSSQIGTEIVDDNRSAPQLPDFAEPPSADESVSSQNANLVQAPWAVVPGLLQVDLKPLSDRFFSDGGNDCVEYRGRCQDFSSVARPRRTAAETRRLDPDFAAARALNGLLEAAHCLAPADLFPPFGGELVPARISKQQIEKGQQKQEVLQASMRNRGVARWWDINSGVRFRAGA